MIQFNETDDAVLKTYPALEKLRFSERQEYFWIEDAELFGRIQSLPSPVQRHVYRDRATGKDMNHQEYVEALAAALKQGQKFSVSHRTVLTDAGDPAGVLAGIPPAKAEVYRRVRQSLYVASSKLVHQAEGQKVSKSGLIKAGNSRLDEKTFVLRLVQKNQSTKPVFRTMPRPDATPEELKRELANPIFKPAYHDLIAGVLNQAIQADDMSYLKAVFRKPQRTSQAHVVVEFLVDFWCGPPIQYTPDAARRQPDFLAERLSPIEPSICHPAFPPLCFFTDEALAEFCSVALAIDANDNSVSFDSVRKKRQRLKLKRPKNPRIRKITVKGDTILVT